MISLDFFAVAGGIELIEEQAEQAINISASFESLWQSIFVDLSGPWIAVNSIASFILAYTFLALLLKLFLGSMMEQWSEVASELAYLLILISLLSNNARPVADIALFVRDFTNNQVQQIYSINLSTVTVESAIRDVLITADVKTEISNKFKACESKTGTLQIDCLTEAGEEAQELIAEAQSVAGNSAGLSRTQERVLFLLNSFANPTIFFNKQGREVHREALNGVVQSSAVQIIRIILKAIQFAFANTLELARLLTGLYGPIAVVLSTIPGRIRPIQSWLIAMIGLSALTWSYVVLIGFSAVVISTAGAQDTTDLGFMVIVSLGIPGLAYALAKGGGEALVTAIATTGLTASRIFSAIF